MKLLIKVAMVLGGYVAAFLIASAAVTLHEAVLSKLATPPSDGMAAGGDLILFVLVFGTVALLPTGAALFFVFRRKNTGKSSPRLG